MRLLPFSFAAKSITKAPVLTYFNRYLPATIMVLLVVYSIKDQLPRGISAMAPELLAISTVIFLQIVVKQPLVSILSGTAVYLLVH